MSERYIKLYSLPERLYAESSPLMIAAGNLLKDNQSGNVLAQLKLKNLGERPIKAAKVRLFPLDTAKKPLGDSLVYEYLDLNAGRDAEFGQKTPFPLPNASTRAILAEVIEVVFADYSVWTECGALWEPLPPAEPLEKALGDGELAKQYRLRFGEQAVKGPARHRDLWRCACGALNRAEEGLCHACRRSRDEQLDCDLSALAAARDARLAAEKEAAEKAAAEAAEKARLEAEKAKARWKKAGKIAGVAAAVAALSLAAFLIVTKVLVPLNQYKKAETLLEAGRYEEAAVAFAALGNYKDAPERILEANYLRAEALFEAGQHQEAALAFGEMGDFLDARERSFAIWDQIAQRDTVSAGAYHTVGLQSDGTVVAAGSNKYNQCDVSGWTDVVAVSAGAYHTVGLRSDGTVVATGQNDDGQCDVSGWQDVVAVSAGKNHTVGLRSDGTMVATGSNDLGQCNINSWTDIVAVSAGNNCTVGLRSDGTVVAAGSNSYGQCAVSGWTDIVAVSAGGAHTVGLRSDGTVVATGEKLSGQCTVNIWENVVVISAGDSHTVGLLADGTVVATGKNNTGQCEVSDWRNIKIPK